MRVLNTAAQQPFQPQPPVLWLTASPNTKYSILCTPIAIYSDKPQSRIASLLKRIPRTRPFPPVGLFSSLFPPALQGVCFLATQARQALTFLFLGLFDAERIAIDSFLSVLLFTGNSEKHHPRSVPPGGGERIGPCQFRHNLGSRFRFLRPISSTRQSVIIRATLARFCDCVVRRLIRPSFISGSTEVHCFSFSRPYNLNPQTYHHHEHRSRHGPFAGSSREELICQRPPCTHSSNNLYIATGTEERGTLTAEESAHRRNSCEPVAQPWQPQV